MTAPRFIQRETRALVARAVNAMLAAHDAGYQVLADDIVITQAAGHVIIALRQARTDGNTVPPPKVNL